MLITTNFFIYLVIFLAFLSLMEVIKRSTSIEAEDSRKIVHAIASLIVATMPLHTYPMEILLLAIGFMGLLFVTRIYGLFTAVQAVKRKTIGEFAFAGGAALAAAVLLPEYPESFICGFIVLGLSDTAAQVIGEWKPIRSFKIFSQGKSIGGSMAFALITIAIFMALSMYFGRSYEPVRLFLAVLAVTVVEFSQVFGVDNLFIPVAAGLVYEWMMTSA